MKFKAVEWVRKVRDEDYEKCRKMSPKEKIEFTKKMAEKLFKKRAKTVSVK
jgi:HD superfamily phosphohydrolase YqeK